MIAVMEEELVIMVMGLEEVDDLRTYLMETRDTEVEGPHMRDDLIKLLTRLKNGESYAAS